MELTESSRKMLVETGKTLKGVERRLFMARTVRSFGIGGQRMAERELGWSRVTVRKGMHELESGIRCEDAYCLRGRKRSEEHLPRLLDIMCSCHLQQLPQGVVALSFVRHGVPQVSWQELV